MTGILAESAEVWQLSRRLQGIMSGFEVGHVFCSSVLPPALPGNLRDKAGHELRQKGIEHIGSSSQIWLMSPACMHAGQMSMHEVH